MQKIKIDLGCGGNKHEGCFGIDWSRENSDADIIADLNNGIPLLDNTVDEVFTSHFLEHIGDLIGMMKEIHRVCKNGARVHIWVPHGLNRMGIEGPEHKHYFAWCTLDHFCFGIESRIPRLFKMIKKEYEFSNKTWRSRVAKGIVKLTGGIRGLFAYLIPGFYFELEVMK